MVRMAVSRGETKLPGDQIVAALTSADPGPPRRERTSGLDPQSMAEFLAYDIPFATEPAGGVTFPPEVGRPTEACAPARSKGHRRRRRRHRRRRVARA